jgi:hypothetical protein
VPRNSDANVTWRRCASPLYRMFFCLSPSVPPPRLPHIPFFLRMRAAILAYFLTSFILQVDYEFLLATLQDVTNASATSQPLTNALNLASFRICKDRPLPAFLALTTSQIGLAASQLGSYLHFIIGGPLGERTISLMCPLDSLRPLQGLRTHAPVSNSVRGLFCFVLSHCFALLC